MSGRSDPAAALLCGPCSTPTTSSWWGRWARARAPSGGSSPAGSGSSSSTATPRSRPARASTSPYIFEKEGEAGFRARERDVLDAADRAAARAGRDRRRRGARRRDREPAPQPRLRRVSSDLRGPATRTHPAQRPPAAAAQPRPARHARAPDAGARAALRGDRRPDGRHRRPQGRVGGRRDRRARLAEARGAPDGAPAHRARRAQLPDPDRAGPARRCGRCSAQAVAARDVLVVTNDDGGAAVPRADSSAGSRASGVASVDPARRRAVQDARHPGSVLDALVERRLNRDACVVALGGGVVGDMAGFAAACYQRGVDYVQVPTTLLAQVDSSVGGKTGVNHPGGKNLIGAFHQPRAVVSDIGTLATLPPRELRAGLAEVIKYGLIADAGFLAWLEGNLDALLGARCRRARARDPPLLRDQGGDRRRGRARARPPRAAQPRPHVRPRHRDRHRLRRSGCTARPSRAGMVMAADLSRRARLARRRRRRARAGAAAAGRAAGRRAARSAPPAPWS